MDAFHDRLKANFDQESFATERVGAWKAFGIVCIIIALVSVVLRANAPIQFSVWIFVLGGLGAGLFIWTQRIIKEKERLGEFMIDYEDLHLDVRAIESAVQHMKVVTNFSSISFEGVVIAIARVRRTPDLTQDSFTNHAIRFYEYAAGEAHEDYPWEIHEVPHVFYSRWYGYERIKPRPPETPDETPNKTADKDES